MTTAPLGDVRIVECSMLGPGAITTHLAAISPSQLHTLERRAAR